MKNNSCGVWYGEAINRRIAYPSGHSPIVMLAKVLDYPKHKLAMKEYPTTK